MEKWIRPAVIVFMMGLAVILYGVRVTDANPTEDFNFENLIQNTMQLASRKVNTVQGDIGFYLPSGYQVEDCSIFIKEATCENSIILTNDYDYIIINSTVGFDVKKENLETLNPELQKIKTYINDTDEQYMYVYVWEYTDPDHILLLLGNKEYNINAVIRKSEMKSTVLKVATIFDSITFITDEEAVSSETSELTSE